MKTKPKIIALMALALLPLSSCAKAPGVTSESLHAEALSQKELLQESKESAEEPDILFTELTDTAEERDAILAKEVVFDYSKYVGTPSTRPFKSRYSKVFKDINGKDVEADLFYSPPWGNLDHPNVGLGILLLQAIRHKLAHPEVENEITITSFHFSIIAGLNLVPSSPYFGFMKSMPDDPIDRDGFVRFSYLLLWACKLGIRVNVVPQLGGYSDYGTEIEPKDYFLSIMDLPCSSKAGLADHKVGEFLNFTSCEWVSYGGKAAADMYHLKTCTVRHFLSPKDGQEREFGIFLSSSNIDGVNADGTPGLSYAQTGLILSNHDYLYRVINNFVAFSQGYCDQDDACAFRVDYANEIRRQKEIIRKTGYQSLDGKEMIYLGTETDQVFELEITPFAEEYSTWDAENPFCRYIDKLEKSRLAISFVWHNPKENANFEFIDILKAKLEKAFTAPRMKDEALKSVLITRYAKDIGKVVEGINCQKKISDLAVAHHEKDCVLRYEENGEVHQVSIMNSMNAHQGSFWYQVNYALTINETSKTGTDLSDALLGIW